MAQCANFISVHGGSRQRDDSPERAKDHLTVEQAGEHDQFAKQCVDCARDTGSAKVRMNKSGVYAQAGIKGISSTNVEVTFEKS